MQTDVFVRYITKTELDQVDQVASSPMRRDETLLVEIVQEFDFELMCY